MALIVLPDRTVSSARVLSAVRQREWRRPSQGSGLYQIENQTRFRLTARLHDGFVKWRGWFDDRDDADAFLLALISGLLCHERALWDLPTETWLPGSGFGHEGWRPDIGEDLIYDFATVSFLTTTSGSNQTYNVSSDFSASSNTVEVLGSGGSGNSVSGQTQTGGGGGAYAKATNVGLTPSGTATYFLNSGGAASTNAAGNAGANNFFNGTLAGVSNNSVQANGGGGGGNGTGGAGGTVVNGSGSSGGSGGTGAGNIGGGGGGAAGSTAAGGAGGNSDGTANAGGGGGADNGATGNGGNPTAGTGAHGGGNGGAGGANGGTTSGTNGSIGTEWDASHGSGGGGGGSFGNAAAGSGGLYGAGSGGAGAGNTSPAGKQGIIVITYTPTSSITLLDLSFIH